MCSFDSPVLMSTTLISCSNVLHLASLISRVMRLVVMISEVYVGKE